MFTKQSRKRWVIVSALGCGGALCLCFFSAWFLLFGANDIFSHAARPPSPAPHPKVAISVQNAGRLERLYQITVTDYVYRIAWSPDSRWLAIDTERFGMPFHSSLYAWDVETGSGHALYSSVEHSIAYLSQIAFLPDGQTLAYRIGPSIRFWDVLHDRELRTEEYDGEKEVDAAFFQAVSGRSFPDMSDVAQVAYSAGLGPDDWADPDNFVFSPNGSIATVTGEMKGYGKFNLHQVPSGTVVQSITGAQPSVFSHNGRMIVSMDDSFHLNMTYEENIGYASPLLLSDVGSGQVLQSLAGVVRRPPRYSMAFSPDDSLLASPAADRPIFGQTRCYVWDTHSGKRYELSSGASDLGGSVAFSPDGRFLAIGWDDGTVLLWGIRPGWLGD